MPQTPKKKSNAPTFGDDQSERGYYYDDAHGYEKYDPTEGDDETSGGGALDVDLDGTPPLLIEPDEAKDKP